MVIPHTKTLMLVIECILNLCLAGATSQAGDTESSRAPGLTSGLQGSMNVHRDTLLLVPQFFSTLHFCHPCSL